jgi:hypothetical protein
LPLTGRPDWARVGPAGRPSSASRSMFYAGRVVRQRPIYACPYCGHHRQLHAPEGDGHDCFWICTLIEPEGPCLCSVLCLEDCGPRHEHGWIDLEEADGRK